MLWCPSGEKVVSMDEATQVSARAVEGNTNQLNYISTYLHAMHLCTSNNRIPKGKIKGYI